jgi:hypothetical protein
MKDEPGWDDMKSMEGFKMNVASLTTSFEYGMRLGNASQTGRSSSPSCFFANLTSLWNEVIIRGVCYLPRGD